MDVSLLTRNEGVLKHMYIFFYRKAAFKGGHSKIHLNLSIALLLGLIVFVGGIENARNDEVSILYTATHVFTIASSFATMTVLQTYLHNLHNFVVVCTYVHVSVMYISA